MLPFPLRVSCPIWFASLSSWNISPLNFSTDQRPFESTSISNIPAFAVVPVAAPALADTYTVLTTSLLISERISEERIFDNSVSASRPWIAFKSCASSIEYSAFSALDLAVTLCFSIENAISEKLEDPSPNSSAAVVVIAIPVTYGPGELSLRTAGLVPCIDVAPPEKSLSASL